LTPKSVAQRPTEHFAIFTCANTIIGALIALKIRSGSLGADPEIKNFGPVLAKVPPRKFDACA
jgi:hypothetical protein